MKSAMEQRKGTGGARQEVELKVVNRIQGMLHLVTFKQRHQGGEGARCRPKGRC